MRNKENIFRRVINFIKRIFGNEEPKQISAKTETIKNKESKSNYFDELKLYKEEDLALLKLQNQYEKGEIDLSAMSDEQLSDLNALYKRQVSELKKKLNDQKTEITILQHKIKSYSANM